MKPDVFGFKRLERNEYLKDANLLGFFLSISTCNEQNAYLSDSLQVITYLHIWFLFTITFIIA